MYIFAVPVFFICFRESLETAIIVSVLLAFLKQALGTEEDALVYRKLVKQVWVGVSLGMAICLCIGAAMIALFYGIGVDTFSRTELIWEGVFALIAAIVISVMGAALLRVSKLQDKWRYKLTRALEARHQNRVPSSFGQRFKVWSEEHAMFILPFVTVLREGLEAVMFIGGVGLSLPASSFPLAVVTGLGAGCLAGYLIYRGHNVASLQAFLILSTCFLYLVGAGLFSRAIWSFENEAWNRAIGGDAAETGSGPGSYDIRQSVWHVNCCNPEIDGGGWWGVFKSILGWTNSATYGSVISYNLYWAAVIATFLCIGYKERKGHYPFQKPIEAVSHEGERQRLLNDNSRDVQSP